MKKRNTYYDEMELLELRNLRDFYSLIFQMLVSYIRPKGRKNFCNILTWQMTRKSILIDSLLKGASLIKMMGF